MIPDTFHVSSTMTIWTPPFKQRLLTKKSIHQVQIEHQKSQHFTNWTNSQFNNCQMKNFQIEQWSNSTLNICQLNKLRLTKIAWFDVQLTFVQLTCVLEWGQAPKPPGFVALARHYAIRQAEPVLNKRHESRQGFEEIITSSRTHGLDQLWLG